MKRIAVVCARPPERNTGMATVDLAAYALFAEEFPDAESTLYAYGEPPAGFDASTGAPFRYKDALQHPELFSSDLIVYWGDFLHARSYWELDRGRWNSQRAASGNGTETADERARFAKYFFLDGEEAARARTIAFGGTIVTNSASDEIDLEYYRHYHAFFSGIAGAYMRDALSSSKIAPARLDQITLGVDCALLLEDKHLELLQDYRPSNQRAGIGVFFGRSASKMKMMLFAAMLGRTLEMKLRWIPWLHSRRRIRAAAKLVGLEAPTTAPTAGAILTALGDCQLVLTDTYHLCVNAWRMGIPAICIGSSSIPAQNSLSDKKKEILYEMYGARDFYIFLENLSVPFGFAQQARQVAAAARNQMLIARIHENIRDHASISRRALTEKASAILAR